MKTERLLTAIGAIDDALIYEAEKTPARRMFSLKRLAAAAACLVLAVGAGLGARQISLNKTIGTFTMDVNPGVMYTVARSRRVKAAEPLNEDAKKALEGVELKGESLSAALSKTITAYVEAGYMKTDGTVLISFDENISEKEAVKNDLSRVISETLNAQQAVQTVVFREADGSRAEEAARELNMSVGKASLVLEASELSGRPASELAELSLGEIVTIESAMAERNDADIAPAPQGDIKEHASAPADIPAPPAAPAAPVKPESSVTDPLPEQPSPEPNEPAPTPGPVYIGLAKAKAIAVSDAGCTNRPWFEEEKLVDGGIKTPYYYLVFADNETRWTYRINAVFGTILEKSKESLKPKYISLEEAKKIALEDAGIVNKVIFEEEKLVDGGIKTPYYYLVFADRETRWTYRIDAVLAIVLERNKEPVAPVYISLEEAKKIALEDAGVVNKVIFEEEKLVDGGIKTPYYYLVFADRETRWTYRIDAVLAIVLERNKEPVAPVFITVEEAKKIALEDAELSVYAQKIVFTNDALMRNQGRPCYQLEFYTGTTSYFYKVDAVTGEIIESRSWDVTAEPAPISAIDQADKDDATPAGEGEDAGSRARTSTDSRENAPGSKRNN